MPLKDISASQPYASASRLWTRAEEMIGAVPLPLLLCAVVLVFLFPVLKNGFVDWDDVQYVLANPALRGSWLDALGFSPGYYHPLTTLTYKFEFSLFGPQAFPFHFTGLVLHLANCASAFYLLAELGARRQAAFIAALLFGLHPVHVEAAAWISGRKELLWGLFSAWTLIFYLRFCATGARRHFAWSLGFFLLALLSKPFAVVLPLALLLADFYRGRAFSARLLLEKLPYLALALPLLSLSTGSSDFLLKGGGGAFNPAGWAAAAVMNAGFYAQKLLLPAKLAILYPVPQWPANAAGLLLLLLLASPAVPLLTGAARQSPPGTGPGLGRTALFGLGFFLITLLPALFISPPADRYDYLPALGLFLVYGELVYGLYAAARRRGGSPSLKGAVILAAALHLLGLGIAAALRVPAWKDSLSLWEDVLAKYPSEYMAYYGRGNALAAAGAGDGALADFTRCLELAPGYWKAYGNRGRLLADKGEFDGAIADYGKAILLQPAEPRLFLNRGNAYFLKGDAARALADYDRALALAPQFAPALENRRRAEEALRAKGRRRPA